jgi:anti-sigma B factor antagonist
VVDGNQDTDSTAGGDESATSDDHARPPGGRCLDLEVVGGVTIVRLRNRVSSPSHDSYTYTDEVGEELYGLAGEARTLHLLLDLTRFETLSHPAELGKLINLRKQVGLAGGKMKLLCPEPGYREMLRITRMDQVFEVYDDERAALGSAW